MWWQIREPITFQTINKVLSKAVRMQYMQYFTPSISVAKRLSAWVYESLAEAWPMRPIK